MNMTQEDFDKLVEDAKPAILNAFKEEVVKSISWDMKNKAITMISAEIEAWVKAEILPDIAEHLASSKEGILAVGKKAADQIGSDLAVAITTEVSERMKDSWKRRTIFKALFE